MESGVDGGFITESEAVRLVRYGTAWDRTRVGATALLRLLKNPDDTAQAFLIGIALNAGAFPGVIARIVNEEEGLALCNDAPRIDSSTVDYDKLRRLPADTLGGAYARYLDDNKLDPDLFQPPPGLPKVASFIVTRIRQTHDVWHALTGYGPDFVGELALQAFTFGQLRIPSAFAIATFGTLLRAPRAARVVMDGYRRGSEAAFLPTVRFEDRWERPLADVRRELRIAPRRDHH